MEFQCRVIVQRRSAPSCGSPVESIPLQAERHSGRRQKLFAFPPKSAFTFRPECCSESQRNGVQLQTGIAFAFDRIPHHTRDGAWPALDAPFNVTITRPVANSSRVAYLVDFMGLRV